MAWSRQGLGVCLAFVCLSAPYLYRLGDVPLIKVDEFWGAQSSWELWKHGRFALPAFKGHLRQEEKTFFHPPGFYLASALFVGPFRPSPWSVRLGPTLFALLSFAVLHAALRRLLAGHEHGRGLALLGVAIAALNPLTFALARHARPETWIMLLGVCAASLLRPRALPALAAGLLSGYALFSHYWAWFLPGLIGLHLLLNREWRPLAWYAAGCAVFTVATAAWILSNRADFIADAGWHRGHLVGGSLLGYLKRRVQDQAELAFDPRTVCVWLVEAVLLLALALAEASAVRRRTLGFLLLLHGMLFLFPRQSPYYPISIVYFCAGALPVVLARGRPAAGAGPLRGRGLAAALAAALLVPAGGLGYMIHRDHAASYEATFRPLREAVDRADPEGKGITIGSEIHYLAFWDRPFLIRWNPYLWRIDAGEDAPEAVVRRWKEIGVRFVLTSSLMPAAARLGPLDPAADRALVEHLRSAGRVLAGVETSFYGEPEHKYRQARIEVTDLGPHGH